MFEALASMAKKLIEDYTLRLNHKEETYNIPVFGRFSVKSFVEYLGLDMSDVESEARYISPLDNIIVNDDYINMQFIAKKKKIFFFWRPRGEFSVGHKVGGGYPDI